MQDGIFPLPPLSPVFRPPSSSSRRLHQRFRLNLTKTGIANAAIGSLNVLAKSFSSKFVPSDSFYSHSRSHRQQQVLSYVKDSCSSFCSRLLQSCDAPVSSPIISSYLSLFSSPSSSLTLPRSLPAQQPDDPAVSWQIPHPEVSPYASQASEPIRLVASQVSLPSQAGTASLLDLLPPDIASIYSSPEFLLKHPSQIKPAPRCTMTASPHEYSELIKRMAALDMISFTTSPCVVNGVFGVRKDADSMRLIVDARAANACFIDSPEVQLPTPDVISSLKVPTGQQLYVGKLDVDNYYHRLRLPQWMVPYFALPPVSAFAMGFVLSPHQDYLIYPCCTTLPMGFSHAVYLAQTSHMNLVDRSCHLLRPCDRIGPDTDLSLSRLRYQLYIDDVIIYGPDPHEIQRAQDEYLWVTSRSGLPAKPSKVVRPSKDGVEVLGLEFRGRDCSLSLSPVKMAKLILDTLAFLKSGFGTGLELSRIVGKWTWSSLVNRPALSVLSSVYHFIRCAGRRRFSIWSSVRNELLTLCGLAPLLFCKLDTAWLPRVTASDASGRGFGVVSTPVAPDMVDALANLAAPADDGAVTASFVHHHKFSTIISSRWKRPDHINTLELRALHTAVRWSLSLSGPLPRRCLVLCDSQVTLGCSRKGRSSSRPLLIRLRALGALLLASGTRLQTLYVNTEHNPADQPSRL